MANFDLRKFLNENKLTRASKALNEVNTRSEAEQDARIFHKDLVDEYDFEKVADALEALYDNAEEGGAGYENIADQLKMDNSMLVDMIKDNLMNEAPANKTSEDKLPTIKISKDIYYFDKLGRLDTKDNVDEKYHNRADLIFKKGQTIKDDTKYEDSDYKMITSSTSLEKGIDYSDDGKAAGGMNVNESTAYQCNTCGERAEHEEIEENPRMRCSNCRDRSWSPEY
jgi:DNA-directed RNA polymerase subunit RPC12/RpoP